MTETQFRKEMLERVGRIESKVATMFVQTAVHSALGVMFFSLIMAGKINF